MQILRIINQNFEKPSRNLIEPRSDRTKVKILKKKNFGISLKKNLVPRMLGYRGNVRTSKFQRKSKEKKRIFFLKNLRRIYKDLIQVKKISKIISCLCTFKETIVNSLYYPNRLILLCLISQCAYVHWAPFCNVLILILCVLLMRLMN